MPHPRETLGRIRPDMQGFVFFRSWERLSLRFKLIHLHYYA